MSLRIGTRVSLKLRAKHMSFVLRVHGYSTYILCGDDNDDVRVQPLASVRKRHTARRDPLDFDAGLDLGLAVNDFPARAVICRVLQFTLESRVDRPQRGRHTDVGSPRRA